MARGCGKVSRVPLGVFSFVVETRAETRTETRKTRDTKRVQHSKTKNGKIIGKQGIK